MASNKALSFVQYFIIVCWLSCTFNQYAVPCTSYTCSLREHNNESKHTHNDIVEKQSSPCWDIVSLSFSKPIINESSWHCLLCSVISNNSILRINTVINMYINIWINMFAGSLPLSILWITMSKIINVVISVLLL